MIFAKLGLTLGASLATCVCEKQQSTDFGIKGGVIMYSYEKAVLKTYKQTDAFIKSIQNAIVKGAYASFGSRKPAQVLAEEILDLHMQKAELEHLKASIDKSLSEMKPCHAYILGVKYGAGSLGVGQTLEKTDGYYKKSAYALGKFVFGMKKLGYTNDIYEELCKRYHYIKSAYDGLIRFEEGLKKSGNLRSGNLTLKGKEKKPFSKV